MVKDKETIKKEIMVHIESRGGNFSSWYAGIATDPEKRLFEEHNVQKNGGKWVHREAASDFIAREVEKYLVKVKGTQGGSGGGDEKSVFVYAYKITSNTNEDC